MIDTIATAAPDIVVLQDIDYDGGGALVDALADGLAGAGIRFQHRFALRPNAGLPSGADLDGDGRLGQPRDAQGYGRFAGAGGMAILSRHPIVAEEARDFSGLLWRDLPGAIPPPMSQAVASVQRLSSVAHWSVPVRVGGETLTVLTWSATPPLFDGPEDRNGRRNRDEAAFWLRLLDGALGPSPTAPFVIAGLANLDPERGEGRRDALDALVSDPRLVATDPATPDGDRATVVFPNAGAMRLSVILPSAGLTVPASGIVDPATVAPDLPPEDRPRHRLVWVDLDWPPAP